jgi:hypothetical protein
MSEIVHLGPSRGEERPAWGFDEAPAILAGAKQVPVRVAVVGEFNSGKTSLVNALLGAPILPTSFTRHTAYPTVVRYAAKRSLAAEIARRRRVPITWDQLDGLPLRHIWRLHLGVPLDRLRTLRVVDTPGLALCDEMREARTRQICRYADTIVWCTPAMQAWKASEQQAWLALPKSVRRRGVLAVTFMDVLRSPGDAGRLMTRLHADAGPFFTRIVTVSTGDIHPALSGAAEAAGA